MINYVKRMPTVNLDAKLTAEPFARWLTRLMGPDAKIKWEVNDCGEQTGGAAHLPQDPPLCVQAEVSLPNNTRLFVMIAIGTVKKGLHGRASIKDVFLEREGEVTTVKELSQLPNMLR